MMESLVSLRRGGGGLYSHLFCDGSGAGAGVNLAGSEAILKTGRGWNASGRGNSHGFCGGFRAWSSRVYCPGICRRRV